VTTTADSPSTKHSVGTATTDDINKAFDAIERTNLTDFVLAGRNHTAGDNRTIVEDAEGVLSEDKDLTTDAPVSSSATLNVENEKQLNILLETTLHKTSSTRM